MLTNWYPAIRTWSVLALDVLFGDRDPNKPFLTSKEFVRLMPSRESLVWSKLFYTDFKYWEVGHPDLIPAQKDFIVGLIGMNPFIELEEKDEVQLVAAMLLILEAMHRWVTDSTTHSKTYMRFERKLRVGMLKAKQAAYNKVAEFQPKDMSDKIPPIRLADLIPAVFYLKLSGGTI